MMSSSNREDGGNGIFRVFAAFIQQSAMRIQNVFSSDLIRQSLMLTQQYKLACHLRSPKWSAACGFHGSFFMEQ